MAAAYAERSPDGPDHFAVVAAKGFHLFGIEPELTADGRGRCGFETRTARVASPWRVVGWAPISFGMSLSTAVADE